jgi:hypothetical protein
MGALPASAAALLAATALLLAGCGDDTPPPTPSSSSVPTTASPTTRSPTPQPESAEEFIRRWVQADIDMQNSGDTREFLALSANCQPCRNLAGVIEKYYSDGGFVRTDGWLILSIKRLPGTSSGDRLVLVRVDGRPTQYRESSGSPIKSLPGGRTQFQFTLRRSGESWRVHDYVEVTS